jgi:hypothetical protein
MRSPLSRRAGAERSLASDGDEVSWVRHSGYQYRSSVEVGVTRDDELPHGPRRLRRGVEVVSGRSGADVSTAWLTAKTAAPDLGSV